MQVAVEAELRKPPDANERRQFADWLLSTARQLSENYRDASNPASFEHALGLLRAVHGSVDISNTQAAWCLYNLSQLWQWRDAQSPTTESVTHAKEYAKAAFVAAWGARESMREDAVTVFSVRLHEALRASFLAHEDPDDLDNLVKMAELCVASAPLPFRARFLEQLASDLEMRFAARSDLEDLNQSIVHRAALAQVEEQEPIHRTRLGLALLLRARTRSSLADAQSAVDHLEHALVHQTGTAQEVSELRLHVAEALLDLLHLQPQRKRSNATTQRAATLARAVVHSQIQEIDSRNRAVLLLSRSLVLAAEEFEDDGGVDEAIALLDSTLPALMFSGFAQRALIWQARALQCRFRRDGTREDIAAAIARYVQGCEVDPTQKEIASDAIGWGRWAAEEGAWVEAARAFQCALSAFDENVAHEHGGGNVLNWVSLLPNIVGRTAYALAKAGDLAGAVAVAERGGAVLDATWRADYLAPAKIAELGHPALAIRLRDAIVEMLRTEGTISGATLARYFLEATNPDIQAEWTKAGISPQLRMEQIREEVTAGGIVDGDPSPQRGAAFAAYLKVRQEVRRAPGCSGVLVDTGLDGEAIKLVAGEGGSLIYLLASDDGGVALRVGSDGSLISIWLPDLKMSSVTERVATQVSAYQQRDGGSGPQDVWESRLDEITAWCWTSVLHPLLTAAGAAEPIRFICRGQINLLPLHAAWVPESANPTGRAYAIDLVRIEYAPSAQALASAQLSSRLSAAQLRAGQWASVLVRDPMVVPIADTAPTSGFRGPAEEWELEALGRLCQQVCAIQGSDATIAAVRRFAAEAQLVHLSCHAQAELVASDLQQGGVALCDGRLSYEDVRGIQAQEGGLAVLAACETALPMRDLPDERSGLAASFLDAGFACVLGTHWAVPHAATSLLMVRYYSLFQQGAHPAEALRLAQIWMRDSTNDEKARLVPGYAGGHVAALGPVARAIWGSARAHSSPYFWAAMRFDGAWQI
ncbi:CHAT domain-containing protein [Streptomyces niveus]|uniref:CHAT domain-containing protein n=1 Tax=Streptomyces niveus TaxID=193462 RepID=UPI0036D33BB0